MAGFGDSCFVPFIKKHNKKVTKDHYCTICNRILIDAQQLDCGHRICKKHIDSLNIQNGEAECSGCNKEEKNDLEGNQPQHKIDLAEIKPDNAANKEIKTWRMRTCPKGCGKRDEPNDPFFWNDLDEHLKDCANNKQDTWLLHCVRQNRDSNSLKCLSSKPLLFLNGGLQLSAKVYLKGFGDGAGEYIGLKIITKLPKGSPDMLQSITSKLKIELQKSDGGSAAVIEPIYLHHQHGPKQGRKSVSDIPMFANFKDVLSGYVKDDILVIKFAQVSQDITDAEEDGGSEVCGVHASS